MALCSRMPRVLTAALAMLCLLTLTGCVEKTQADGATVVAPPTSTERPLLLRMATSGLIEPADIITSSQAPLMYFRSVKAMYFGRNKEFN